ncbi:MAG: sugar transporter permease [Microbacterium sp.]|jgi:raffinose/stachyose/melibiose transport system permease protein|uniref:carbohydrate ABC transporter permease n=1 Tax=Microbacterium sp. TaxID=51671 RepID=UPI00262BE5E6|nr:carbohydrate ABC transporter permease [Microbacterium sp.]MDF2559400.1 sugar transporter permease [Microbacterium sp.]
MTSTLARPRTPKAPPAEPAATSSPRRRTRAGLGTRIGVQAVLWIYAAIAFGPILLVLLGSLRPTNEILQNPIALPTSFDLSNYVRAWESASLGTYFINSVFITICSVALCVTVSVAAAFVITRRVFRGRAFLAAFFIAGLMVPAKLGLLPIYYMFQAGGLVDTHLGLILLYAASGIPFTMFVLMGFMRGLPVELEEAARLDGANDGRIFWSVILPLVRPALAVVTIFQFAPTWNDFFYPLVLLRDTDKYTIPVGLTQFFGEYSADRGTLFAGLIIALLPLALVFAFASKQIMSGLTAGISK